MSRVGNNPISIPEGVSIEVNKDIITVKGKNGEMNQAFDGVSFDNLLMLYLLKETRSQKITSLNTGFTDLLCLTWLRVYLKVLHSNWS